MKLFFLAMTMVLAGCVSASREPSLVLYGQVVSVQPHMLNEQRVNLTGALVGGVAGGMVGNQFGKGNGRKAMTVLGVVAGAAVVSQVGASYEVKEVTDLEVRMADNNTIALTTGNVGFAIGQSVKITQQGKKATIEVVN